MAYQTQHLDTIVTCARAVMALAESNNGEAQAEVAVRFALDSIEQTCRDTIGGKRPSMTTEQVDEYRELAGVVRDVRNGFVSPTVGNVWDYVVQGVEA